MEERRSFFSKQNDHKKYLKIKNSQSQNNKFFPFKFHHLENSIQKNPNSN